MKNTNSLLKKPLLIYILGTSLGGTIIEGLILKYYFHEDYIGWLWAIISLVISILVLSTIVYFWMKIKEKKAMMK